MQCDGDSATVRCVGGVYVAGEACSSDAPICSNGRCVACEAGAVECAGVTPRRCVDGQWQSEAPCTLPTPICSELTGQCVACTAGMARCGPDRQPQVCDDTGGWAAGTPCGVGSQCIYSTGQCGPAPRDCILDPTLDASCTCLVGDTRACGSSDCPSVETCTLSFERSTSSYGPCTPLSVTIPDPALAQAVRTALRIPSDAPVPPERASEITRLNGSSAGITSLEGVACLSGLETLFVPGNQITDLTPVRSMTQLIELNVQFNQIRQVSPLANLLALERLFITDNPLSDANVLATLPALRELNLLGTGVTDVSWVTGLADTLTALEIGQYSPSAAAYPIIDLAPIAALRALTRFSLMFADVVDFAPLSQLPPLDQLTLRSAGLESLSPIQSQTSLTSLNLQANLVSDISLLASFTRLRVLELTSNPIADLSQLAALPPLQSLGVGAIGLTSFAPIQNQTSLTGLTISNNDLTDLTPMLTLFPALEIVDVFNLGFDCGQPPLSTLAARGVTINGCP